MTNQLGGPWIRAILGVAGLPVIFLAGMHVAYADKIYPGVHSGPVSLAGRTQADAESLLRSKASGLKELRFEHQGNTYTIPAGEVGLRMDAAATAKTALSAGRGPGWRGLVGPYRAALGNPDITIHYQLDEAALSKQLADRTKHLATPMKNAEIRREGTDFSIVKERPGRVVDPAGNLKAARLAIEDFSGSATLYIRSQSPDIYAKDLTTPKATAEQIAASPLAVQAGDRIFRPDLRTKSAWVTFVRKETAPEPLRKDSLLAQIDKAMSIGENEQRIIPTPTATLEPEIDQDRVGEYVKEVADEVDSPPVNARLGFVNGQVTVMGEPKNGTVVERQQAVKVVAAAAKQFNPVASVPIVSKPADIRAETLPTLGLTKLIGSSTTSFPGSPPGRTYNIGVGARQFDGVLIKPGEEFSFNRILGDVGPETGYVPELVILENKTEKQYGGGLCQVSTTMFRAALDAGLPITARTNHSYAVHYYAPIGMDATIYPPNPDMRFRNNTPGWILVQTRTGGQSVTFDFYGSDDGRQSSARVVSINASEEDGGTASFRYTVTGGPEPIDRVFYSTYKPKSQFPESSSLN